MQQKSDNVVSHYVFEAPVRIWHWLTVLCMAVLMVTGYFIGKPLPSVSGEATYLFYMGYIRLIHFSAGMIFTGSSCTTSRPSGRTRASTLHPMS